MCLRRIRFQFSASAGFSHFAWQRVRALFAVEDCFFVGQFFYVWHAAVTTPRGARGALDPVSISNGVATVALVPVQFRAIIIIIPLSRTLLFFRGISRLGSVGRVLGRSVVIDRRERRGGGTRHEQAIKVAVGAIVGRHRQSKAFLLFSPFSRCRRHLWRRLTNC